MSGSDAVRKVVIVGSGPAGYTAAIYAARANLRPLLFEGVPKDVLIPGGQLMLTSDVENYPGFPKGILGPELMQLFREQAVRFGTEIVGEDVTDVDVSTRPFRTRAGEREVLAETLIVATGASANWLGLPSEAALRGRGVSACAVCDAAFFRNKDVVVVGGGDSAMEEASFLTKFASKVAIVHRRDAFRASKIMQDRALRNPKIEVIWNTAVEEVLDPAAEKVTGVRLRDVRSGKTWTRATDGFFLAIGHTPNTQVFRGKLALDPKGFVEVRRGTETSVPGIFAAGDVMDPVYKQAVTAAGTGCMAALDAERFLEAHPEPHSRAAPPSSSHPSR